MSLADKSFNGLSKEDQQFDAKWNEIKTWLAREPLPWLLIIAALLEHGYPRHAADLSKKVNDVFVGNPTALVEPYKSINIKTPQSEEIATPPPLETNVFTVGQRVLTQNGSVSREGVIAEVGYLSDRDSTDISYYIVNFNDGTWGGFDPYQISPLTISDSLQTTQTSP